MEGDPNGATGVLILMGLGSLFFIFLTAFGIAWQLKRRSLATVFGVCFLIVAAVLIYVFV